MSASTALMSSTCRHLMSSASASDFGLPPPFAPRPPMAMRPPMPMGPPMQPPSMAMPQPPPKPMPISLPPPLFLALDKLRVTYAETLRTAAACICSKPAIASQALWGSSCRNLLKALSSNDPSSFRHVRALSSSSGPGMPPRSCAVLTAFCTNAEGFRTSSVRVASLCRMLKEQTGWMPPCVRCCFALSSHPTARLSTYA
mmetsp:Transcript_101155/g.261415  ORF Transcript_101155/g.261415 Transcript_101155/m.261415 type:complete len:200 (+) Transcript_101155:456-1055(+)